jgi:hypothetical protein
LIVGALPVLVAAKFRRQLLPPNLRGSMPPLSPPALFASARGATRSDGSSVMRIAQGRAVPFSTSGGGRTMISRITNRETLRRELRGMSRGDLLIMRWARHTVDKALLSCLYSPSEP